jgi:hypothetical protein
VFVGFSSPAQTPASLEERKKKKKEERRKERKEKKKSVRIKNKK